MADPSASSSTSTSTRKRYALVGTGARAIFYYTAIATTYAATSRLVGFCDTNRTRMRYANARLEALGHGAVPAFAAADFDRMVAETAPDEVIVTSIDRTHDVYIVRALELGCGVVTEKPMTIDAPRCARILAAAAVPGRPRVRVAFNYRYAPHNTAVAALLRAGAIGTVTSVHFEWLLDTRHGADYFRRWHRDRRSSGGLLVHKSTHHFDLVNFWLQTRPATVYALGDLRFYGRENAEARGVYGGGGGTRARARDSGSSEAAAAAEAAQRGNGNDDARDDDDPFALDLASDAQLRSLYLDAEHEDGYRRDQDVFGDGISIEDTMSLLVRYRSGAVLTYALTAYAPWEGFRVGFAGTAGRLELEVVENSYVSGGGGSGGDGGAVGIGGERDERRRAAEGALERRSLVLRPLFEPPREIEIPDGPGGAHGGGDAVLLEDLFGEPVSDEHMRAASHVDGALSILTGIAANRSIATGQVVNVDDILKIPEDG
ncbi:NAD-binding Rossmann fold oxidoreductase family protein [Xylariaceae sp. FL0804]|nr:NAD-binding Rossmann fold oxidoreductase family protein [Xylariaceae sp. FL0804]